MHEMPKGNYLIFELCKITLFSKEFFWLIDYISFNIDTTDTYYVPNNWKLSQDSAEIIWFELLRQILMD